MPRGVPRDKSINKRLAHRLKIARGHLEKVIQMTEDGEYCMDIIHQSQAVQAALKEVDHLILKNHMETCMADSIRKGDGREVVGEVMKVMERI